MSKQAKKVVSLLMVFVVSMFICKTHVFAEENAAFGQLNNFRDFMKNMYADFENNDYVTLQSLDGSEMANTLVEMMKATGIKGYYYIVEGTTDTGNGVGVYLLESGGYTFYYGSFVNGQRSGQGIEYFDYSGVDDPLNIYYYTYSGEWMSDAPNGQGTVRFVTYNDQEQCYIVTKTGTYTNGLENGNFVQYGYDGINFLYHTWNSVNGIPQEVSYMTEGFFYDGWSGWADGNPMQIPVYDMQGNPIVGYVFDTIVPYDISSYTGEIIFPTTDYLSEAIINNPDKTIYAAQCVYNYRNDNTGEIISGFPGLPMFWWINKGDKAGVVGFENN